MNINKLRKRFVAVSGTGKRQSAMGTALLVSDILVRDNCTIEIQNERERETVYDCSGQDVFDEVIESQFKRVTITYSSVTAQIIARWLAYFLGAAAAPVVSGSKRLHALTRSSSDDLPKTGFIVGFEDETLAEPQLHKDFVVESLNIQLNRRKNVTLAVSLVGNFTTADATDFAAPACANLPALKGKDCKLSINGVSYTADLWQLGI
jgi:hypothetical protein